MTYRADHVSARAQRLHAAVNENRLLAPTDRRDRHAEPPCTGDQEKDEAGRGNDQRLSCAPHENPRRRLTSASAASGPTDASSCDDGWWARQQQASLGRRHPDVAAESPVAHRRGDRPRAGLAYACSRPPQGPSSRRSPAACASRPRLAREHATYYQRPIEFSLSEDALLSSSGHNRINTDTRR